MRAVAIGRLVTSSLVCLGLSLRRRRLRSTVTSPIWRSWACLRKVQKVRCRPVGTSGGNPDSMVMVDGQVGDDIPQIVVIGELPATGEGNDKEPAAGLNGLEIFARGVGGIGDH